jgi:hypothetical protein
MSRSGQVYYSPVAKGMRGQTPAMVVVVVGLAVAGCLRKSQWRSCLIHALGPASKQQRAIREFVETMEFLQDPMSHRAGMLSEPTGRRAESETLRSPCDTPDSHPGRRESVWNQNLTRLAETAIARKQRRETQAHRMLPSLTNVTAPIGANRR